MVVYLIRSLCEKFECFMIVCVLLQFCSFGAGTLGHTDSMRWLPSTATLPIRILLRNSADSSGLPVRFISVDIISRMLLIT